MPHFADQEDAGMARGRNSKSAVLKDEARDRRRQEADAMALESAVAVVQRRFAGETELTERLDQLAGQIREAPAGQVDLIAGPFLYIARKPLPWGG
jgi:hypothetical protein